jgi:hypothetical protein
MVKGLHTQRRRRTAAWLVCSLWLLAVEVLPNLHLLVHHDDHSHDDTGAIVATHDHDHGHAAQAQHHDEAPHDWDDVDPFAPAHAAAGIAHHATALHQPPPPMLAPLPVELAASWIVHAPCEAPTTTQLARPTARGPPGTA